MFCGSRHLNILIDNQYVTCEQEYSLIIPNDFGLIDTNNNDRKSMETYLDQTC